ncbi:MAG: hypothetical protein HW380_1695 [Magnetococcales bacterium]|nr:hypothetical protein [Magnetococcales bacterium]HIJ85842.1 hypothetical protein [Magnetococcales bacterium]
MTKIQDGILITRISECQIHCANKLFREGLISTVYVEDGHSFTKPQGMDHLVFAIRRLVRLVLMSPRSDLRQFFLWIRNLLHWHKWYGQGSYHERRMFGIAPSAFDDGLQVIRIPGVNDPGFVQMFAKKKQSIIFVFGTVLIKKPLLSEFKVPAINLHWGWSPYYRGEGIIPALAQWDLDHLGVTVHLLSEKADAGNILFQETIKLDEEDNFFSIGQKMALKGADLLVQAGLHNINNTLTGVVQDLSQGKIYSGNYLLKNPDLYWQAHKNMVRFRQSRKKTGV